MGKKKSEGSPAAPRVSPEEFVTTWQAAKSLEEAKEKLGVGAGGRAARYRKLGVQLKEFEGARKRINVTALNKLV